MSALSQGLIEGRKFLRRNDANLLDVSNSVLDEFSMKADKLFTHRDCLA